MSPGLTAALQTTFGIVEWGLLAYMIGLNISYVILMATGWRAVHHYVRLRPLRDYAYVATSPMSMPVSILMPAHNESATIAEAVRSLLNSQYSTFEVIVVNDGSRDATLKELTRAFELVPMDLVPRAGLATAQIRGTYLSAQTEQVIVIDKEQGGKADALNAGINYAQYPLVCAIDADTILDTGALARLVWEFQSHPDTVATGGIVRIVNGSSVDAGLVTAVRTPRNLLVNIQIMEYLRAFLGGRLAWSRWNLLIIISGAFGLFRRDVLIDVGGYDVDTITEDAELILRIRRTRQERSQPCRITFFPDPICWTQAPQTASQLARQRDRWQRGLGEMLLKHRDMLLRPRYGRTGMVALPYYWLFEFLEPAITVIGLAVATLGLVLGFVDPVIYVLIVALSTVFGLLLSLGIILMEERAFRRYPNWVDLRRMSLAVLVENFGYRQWQSFIRLRAALRIGSHRRHWGEMTRQRFTAAEPG